MKVGGGDGGMNRFYPHYAFLFGGNDAIYMCISDGVLQPIQRGIKSMNIDMFLNIEHCM